MKKSRVSYKEALKSQYGICIVAVLIIIGIIWIMGPVTTLDRQFLAIGLIAAIGGVTFYAVRRGANRVVCESCNSNLYEIIEHAKTAKIEVNYCPACGSKVDT